jgi:hypothetical protein
MRIQATRPGFYAIWKSVRLWWFYVGLIWTIPFGLACWAVVDWHGSPSSSKRMVSFSLLSIAAVGLAILLERSAGLSHYAAPILPLTVLVIVDGLRRLWIWKIGRLRTGRTLVCALCCSAVLFCGLQLFVGPPPSVRAWSLERARLQREFGEDSRPSLLIVKYGPQHSMHEEWVYNRADIDHAHVVWARQLAPARMPELLKLFPDRDVWLVEPDETPIRVTPFQR